MLCCFFALLDLLGDSVAPSLFDSVLVLAFSDFVAGSSGAFFSGTDPALVDEGLDGSFAGRRVFAVAFGAAGGGVVAGSGLLAGVALTVAAGTGGGDAAVGDATAVGAAVALRAAVVLVEELTPVVVAFVTPTPTSALKRGAAIP